MPRLAYRGKWVFGWTMVSPDRRVAIPQEAIAWYNLVAGECAILLRGSRTSGGVAICPGRLWPDAFGDWRTSSRALGRIILGVDLTASLVCCQELAPGDHLLAVYGSGNALGLLARGPIYRFAQDFPLETFSLDSPAHRHTSGENP